MCVAVLSLMCGTQTLLAEELPGWAAVRQLEPGKPIVVTTGAATVRRIFVTASADQITVLNLDAPGLPDRAKRQLHSAAIANPDALAAAADGAPKGIDDFVIGPDGVFLRGVRLAERSEVIQRLAAVEVVTIGAGRVRRGSAGAAATAAVAGLWLMWQLRAISIESPQGAAVLVAVPIAAGTAAWAASSKSIDEIIYRRTSPQTE